MIMDLMLLVLRVLGLVLNALLALVIVQNVKFLRVHLGLSLIILVHAQLVRLMMEERRNVKFVIIQFVQHVQFPLINVYKVVILDVLLVILLGSVHHVLMELSYLLELVKLVTISVLLVKPPQLTVWLVLILPDKQHPPVVVILDSMIAA